MRARAAAGAALALAGLAGEARAQDGPRVALLTMAPGEHPFLAFGHSALWIHDPRLKGDDVDLVYNFGTFDFGSPRVVVDFARGQMRYWLSIGTLGWTTATYGAEGRTVRAQQLALSPGEIDRLERALLIGARPENREYAYGYIDHNCATRLRDAVDEASGGAMRAALSGPGPGATYRREIARVLGAHLLLGEAVDAVTGPAVDRPIDAWQAAFLPDRFSQALARGRRPAAAGEDGGAPMVASERTLVERGRWFSDRAAPDRRAGALALGAAGGAALALAGRRRRALGVAVAVVGGAIGALGVLLVLFGVVHPLGRWNVNVLHAAPLAAWLAYGGARLARGDAAVARRALAVAALGLGASALGWLLSLAGATPQPGGALAALLGPLWAGMVAGLAAARPEAGGPARSLTV